MPSPQDVNIAKITKALREAEFRRSVIARPKFLPAPKYKSLEQLLNEPRNA